MQYVAIPANKDKAQEGSSVHEMLILLQPRDERLESASETHHTTASILGREMTLSIILTQLSNLVVKLSKITQKIGLFTSVYITRVMKFSSKTGLPQALSFHTVGSIHWQ